MHHYIIRALIYYKNKLKGYVTGSIPPKASKLQMKAPGNS